MRRRRQWLEAAVSSPTSRRRLEDSPTGEIVRQFGSALDSVNITLELPSSVIDLTSEQELDAALLQNPAVHDNVGEENGEHDESDNENNDYKI